MKIVFNKMTYILILSLLFFLIFSSKGYCAKINPEETPVRQESITIVKNDNITAGKYTITPGDIISVSVYDEPNLLQPEIIVRPDGFATIDPIGEVFVEGYDIKELTKILKNEFQSYLNYPVISVNIKEFNPASVYIFGAVQKPGTYQQITQTGKSAVDSKNPTVKTDLTLTNVIGNAGGISEDADLSNITVTSSGKNERKVDLWKFIKDGDTSQNFKLKTGDVIFVPRSNSILINDENFKLLSKMAFFPTTFPVRVIGEVNQSGSYNITGESPYLNTAVADASGYTLDANQSVIVVYRKANNDKLTKILVDPFNYDFVLRPNDLVEVRKRTFMKAVSGAGYFATLIQPFISLPNMYNTWAEVYKPSRRYQPN